MTNETRWTPGKWHVNSGTGLIATVGTSCDVYAEGEVNSDPAPDAHLIASAPDLYAALKHLVDILECELGGPHPTLNCAYAALARARGQTNQKEQP